MSSEILDVTVAPMPATQRPLLERLLQLYLHDFSEYTGIGSRYGGVDEAGQFAYPPGLDAYWQDPSHTPMLIRADDIIAGFMLLHQWSALDQPLDHAVAEFFVLRKYRRTHVGTRAAHCVFGRYPGRWEVAVAGYNQAALLFWRSVAGGLVGSVELAGDGRRWSGPVLCFNSPAVV